MTNLEAEDATPSMRRRVEARIAEREETVEERRQHAIALAAQSTDSPPTVADLTIALDFQSQTRTIEVEVTLVADE